MMHADKKININMELGDFGQHAVNLETLIFLLIGISRSGQADPGL